MSQPIQHYSREQFEHLPASELLANRKHQYWLADGRGEQYSAAKVTDTFLVPSGIYISYEIRHGTIYHTDTMTINHVNLDNGTCELSRIVTSDTQLLVLKREYEPGAA